MPLRNAPGNGPANPDARVARGAAILRGGGVIPGAPDWITGARETIAVRRSSHPLASALCRATDSPLVSTSCNPHGLPPARTAKAAREYFGNRVDWILEGQCGPLNRPTEIRDAVTGAILRPG